LIARVRVRNEVSSFDIIASEHVGSAARQIVTLVGDFEGVYFRPDVDRSNYVCV
jgi:hypothetical protein